MIDDSGEDYLWDGAGMPDAFTQKLEELLAPYRHPHAACPADLMDVEDDAPLPGPGE